MCYRYTVSRVLYFHMFYIGICLHSTLLWALRSTLQELNTIYMSLTLLLLWEIFSWLTFYVTRVKYRCTINLNFTQLWGIYSNSIRYKLQNGYISLVYIIDYYEVFILLLYILDSQVMHMLLVCIIYYNVMCVIIINWTLWDANDYYHLTMLSRDLYVVILNCKLYWDVYIIILHCTL